MTKKYTAKQGQYLAFIYYYTRINGRPPAQADIQHYFGVSPPTVHNMIVTLERKGLLFRRMGSARTIEVLVKREDLPPLD